MKKFLSLVLALVMTMSLVTVAGASYTDESSINYGEAVDVISALDIVGGYADGTFNPEGTLTRGAAAKIICNILVGPKTAAELVAAEAPYADVPADHVFAGYIAYCANAGIISGYADGTFKPAATLTGYAFMKMLLGALNYDAAIEGYTGANWAINVAQDVVERELAKGLEDSFNGTKALTREEACLYAFNTLKAKVGKYTEKGSNITIGDIVINTAAGDYEIPTGAKTLYETKFAANFQVGDETADKLGRPAHEWEIKKDGKWETIGVYADAATLTLTNAYTATKLADTLEDAGLTLDTSVTLTTANGKTIEIFDKDEDKKVEAGEYIEIAASLVKVTGTAADKATVDGDNRTISLEGMATLIADADSKNKPTSYVVPSNFEELYAELKGTKAADDVKVLVVAQAAPNATKAFSVEIPEIVEAKITKANAAKTEIVADGVTYKVAPAATSAVALGKAKLTVGADGIVYAVAGVGTTTSDVIYLDVAKESKDTWGGNAVWNAQIVTEAGEIQEIVLDKEYTAKKFYTYTINDKDQYVLADATLTAVTADIAGDALKIGTQYFADDVTFVYVDGTGTKLATSVKEGVQKVTVTGVDVTTTASYIYDATAKEITVVFVMGKHEAVAVEGEELIYVADATITGQDTNKEGKAEDTYTIYMDGVKTEGVMIEGTVATGFYTYTINEKTGEFELKAAESANAKKIAVDASAFAIAKDKYVTYGTTLTDAVLSADAEIYDLTDNGLNTLATIASWDANEEALTVSFVYDTKDNVVTLIYVEKA